ncbi:MAG: hypothetical protein ACOX6T_05885 [Myxococcales bacterium]|jgi:hypothetical protein
MRFRNRLAALFALLGACAAPRAVPSAESSLGPDERLTGTVWWHRPSDGQRCLAWTFVPNGPDGVHLERREIEVEDGWSREVRTFYSIAREFGHTVIYAPGYEYRWVQEPGPDVHSFPGQRGALGYVMGFCVLSADAERIEWMEAPCGTPHQPEAVRRWYRTEAACRASIGR